MGEFSRRVRRDPATFLAGTEIDPRVVRKHFRSSMSIGVVGFFAPYLGVLAYAHFVIHWPWDQAQIAGISLSTTSVAVVYAVMIETGFNRTEIGKIILAACSSTISARCWRWAWCSRTTILALAFRRRHRRRTRGFPRYAPWFFKSLGHRVSEPETKFVALILLALGGLASLPAARRSCPPISSAWRWRRRFCRTRVAAPHADHRLHHPDAVLFPQGRIAGRTARCGRIDRTCRCLSRDQDGDKVHRHPAADPFHAFDRREGMYMTLLDVDRPDFRLDSALFGLTNHIIDQASTRFWSPP